MKHLPLVLIASASMWGCAETNPLPPSPVYPAPAMAEYKLFGEVTEPTPAGPRPLEGVVVTAMTCSPDDGTTGCALPQYPVTTTDADGFYTLPGMFAGSKNTVWILKEGYRRPTSLPECRDHDCYRERLTITADTKLDAQLVRE